MGEYNIQEIRNLNAEGEKILIPRIKTKGQLSTKDLIREIVGSTSFTAADVTGLLSALSDVIAGKVAEGHTVKLDGIGTFSATLCFSKTVDEEHASVNARNVKIKAVKCLVDKELVGKTAFNWNPVRSKSKFGKSSEQYSFEERRNLALQYLNENRMLTIADYKRLTGLLQTKAGEELRAWAKEENSPILRQGSASHVHYVLREANQ